MRFTKGEWLINMLNDVGVKGSKASICHLMDNYPPDEMDANAKLIISAPDLYEACKAQHEAIDILFARLIELDHTFFPSKSGKPWEAIILGNKALAKAEGK